MTIYTMIIFASIISAKLTKLNLKLNYKPSIIFFKIQHTYKIYLILNI